MNNKIKNILLTILTLSLISWIILPKKEQSKCTSINEILLIIEEDVIYSNSELSVMNKKINKKIMFEVDICEISNDEIDKMLKLIDDTSQCNFIFSTKWSMQGTYLINSQKYNTSTIQLEVCGLIEALKEKKYPYLLNTTNLIDTTVKFQAIVNFEKKERYKQYLNSLRK